MNDTKKLFSILNIITVVLLLTVTVCGVLSFDTTHTFETINQLYRVCSAAHDTQSGQISWNYSAYANVFPAACRH